MNGLDQVKNGEEVKLVQVALLLLECVPQNARLFDALG